MSSKNSIIYYIYPLLLIIFSGIVKAAPILSSNITHYSNTGVFRLTVGSFDNLVDASNQFDGVGFERIANEEPTVTYNLNTPYQVNSINAFGRFGSNSQGAVNSFRLDFYSGLNRNDQLIGSFNSGLFSPDHLLSWDVSALNLLGVQSFTLVMLERDAITSPSVPGQWYEMGHLSLDASPVPIPAAAWLLGSALIGLFGIKLKKY